MIATHEQGWSAAWFGRGPLQRPHGRDGRAAATGASAAALPDTTDSAVLDPGRRPAGSSLCAAAFVLVRTSPHATEPAAPPDAAPLPRRRSATGDCAREASARGLCPGHSHVRRRRGGRRRRSRRPGQSSSMTRMVSPAATPLPSGSTARPLRPRASPACVARLRAAAARQGSDRLRSERRRDRGAACRRAARGIAAAATASTSGR